MVYDSYDAAKKDCPEGFAVGGTYRDDDCKEAVYFHHPAGAEPDELRKLAFQAKHGKPMTPYQEWVHEMAMRLEVVR